MSTSTRRVVAAAALASLIVPAAACNTESGRPDVGEGAITKQLPTVEPGITRKIHVELKDGSGLGVDQCQLTVSGSQRREDGEFIEKSFKLNSLKPDAHINNGLISPDNQFSFLIEDFPKTTYTAKGSLGGPFEEKIDLSQEVIMGGKNVNYTIMDSKMTIQFDGVTKTVSCSGKSPSPSATALGSNNFGAGL